MLFIYLVFSPGFVCTCTVSLFKNLDLLLCTLWNMDPVFFYFPTNDTPVFPASWYKMFAFAPVTQEPPLSLSRLTYVVPPIADVLVLPLVFLRIHTPLPHCFNYQGSGIHINAWRVSPSYQSFLCFPSHSFMFPLPYELWYLQPAWF